MNKLDKISKDIQDYIELYGLYVEAANDIFLQTRGLVGKKIPMTPQLEREYNGYQIKIKEVEMHLKKLGQDHGRITNRGG